MSDLRTLFERLLELGPLGARFEAQARRALQVAEGLPPEERRRLEAAVLEAAVYDSRRLEQAETARRDLEALNASLQEVSVRLAQATTQAAESIERLREFKKYLERS